MLQHRAAHDSCTPLRRPPRPLQTSAAAARMAIVGNLVTRATCVYMPSLQPSTCCRAPPTQTQKQKSAMPLAMHATRIGSGLRTCLLGSRARGSSARGSRIHLLSDRLRRSAHVMDSMPGNKGARLSTTASSGRRPRCPPPPCSPCSRSSRCGPSFVTTSLWI